jgi:hypothetical protein
MPPTYVSLVDIAVCNTCSEAKAMIGSREAIVYAPRMVFVEDGRYLFPVRGRRGL